MGEPAVPIRRRIELTVAEARLRFQQLVRVTGVTGQVTVVVDGGRPIAAIVPVSDLVGDKPPAGAPPAPPPVPRQVAPIHAAPSRVEEGWLQRIERVREDVRRQHAGRISELTRALDEAWAALDAVRPAGADRVVDTLRAAHGDLRRPR
ncbi:antitoxin (DNA-binding transcriptional repressor) of toxin-antitoxin stability system [Actinoplanes lutulentus]|uniref:Antitoxin n=1 Tax=Actinoplanes lutulentus TaxID=1287878 RepID=A0A327ZHZ1_9ACTN|nr:hypothetical protein [Actinoplanes lutulentus]MBB2944190.1 antitoxin (DNA-binding transcriptional repressor) of toxin-antitoxin stability system [Actinoplanes lutulentus]RAK42577.1 hypothetical protein B0I29_102402 [Actinoplanes lutulentus]